MSLTPARLNEAVALAVRHSCWANLKLIEFCKGLSAEQLAWTVPGTYGSIERTLRHIVSADQGYLLALIGEIPGDARADPDVRMSSMTSLQRCRRSSIAARSSSRSRSMSLG